MRNQIASRGIAYAGYALCIFGCIAPIAGLALPRDVSFWFDIAVLSLSLFIVFVGLVVVEISYERLRKPWFGIAFTGMLGFAAGFMVAVLMHLNTLGPG